MLGDKQSLPLLGPQDKATPQALLKSHYTRQSVQKSIPQEKFNIFILVSKVSHGLISRGPLHEASMLSEDPVPTYAPTHPHLGILLTLIPETGTALARLLSKSHLTFM